MLKESRTFRIFVSSTFSDLKEERNATQRRVAMFWKRKKQSLYGTADRLENASQEERSMAAYNLWRFATELEFRRKYSYEYDAASEAIKLFEGLDGHEIHIARLYGLLGNALEGLSMNSDAARMYLMLVHLSKEADPASYHLQCNGYIKSGFAQLHAGNRQLNRQLARIAWKNAAQLCKVLERKANESITTKKFDHLLVQIFNLEKKKLEDYACRINKLHAEIGSVMLRPSAEEIYEVGCQCIKEGIFWWAIETFTSLTSFDAADKRGWLGRADACIAFSYFLAEDYLAKGGKQYRLGHDELLSPVSEPLKPLDKQRCWKINERIMKLQFAAKMDYQKVLELDRHNQTAIEALRDMAV